MKNKLFTVCMCRVNLRSIPSICTMLFTVLFFYSTKIHAQEMKDFRVCVALLKQSAQQADNDKAAQLISLSDQLQPTLFLSNGSIKKYGQAPAVCIDADMASIGMLSTPDTAASHVEFIRIRVKSASEAGQILRSSDLQSYSRLKYVLFLCSFNCNPLTIKNMYQKNTVVSPEVFYEISVLH